MTKKISERELIGIIDYYSFKKLFLNEIHLKVLLSFV